MIFALLSFLLVAGIAAIPLYFFLFPVVYVGKTKWTSPPGKVLSDPKEQEMKDAVAELRKNFTKYRTSKINDTGRWDLEWRLKNLRGIFTMLVENEAKIYEAAKKDLNKPTAEWFIEKQALLADLRTIIKGVKSWMRPEYRGTPIWMMPASSYVVHEPYGVTLVLSPWNYPMALSLLPLAAGIAAGNAVVLKPSELSLAQSDLLAELLPQYLDPEAFRVCLGGPETARNLVEQDWDFVFFTGSTKTGALVGTSCAKRLIPCALELGGKSPTIIDQECDLTVTCRRIIQAKFINSSQTCIACDYVLIIGDENRKKVVLESLKEELKAQFGHDIQNSGRFGRIINDTHFQRVSSMLKDGEVCFGGKTDAKDKYIEPTLMLVNSQDEKQVMSEEIFGPILPILLFRTLDDAISFINSKPKPLALYLFSSNQANIDQVLSKTTSGSACVNEAVFQYLNPYLPFGGVGPSGVGSNHGKSGFLEFSHSKAVLERGTKTDVPLRYLPHIEKPWVQSVFEVIMGLD